MDEDCPPTLRGASGYRKPSAASFTFDWNQVLSNKPFYVDYNSIRLDPEALKIGGAWFFAPHYFHELPPMDEVSVTLFAFASWFTEAFWLDPKGVRLYCRRDGAYPGRCGIDQRLIDTNYYWRNVCVQKREFRDTGRLPVGHLRDDYLSKLFEHRIYAYGLPSGRSLLDYCEPWLIRDQTEVPYVMAMKQLLDTTSQPVEDIHLLESDVTLLRVPTLLRRDFRFTRGKRTRKRFFIGRTPALLTSSQSAAAVLSRTTSGRLRC